MEWMFQRGTGCMCVEVLFSMWPSSANTKTITQSNHLPLDICEYLLFVHGNEYSWIKKQNVNFWSTGIINTAVSVYGWELTATILIYCHVFGSRRRSPCYMMTSAAWALVLHDPMHVALWMCILCFWAYLWESCVSKVFHKVLYVCTSVHEY